MKLFSLCLAFLFALGTVQFVYAQCQSGETEILLNLVPDNFGSETTWRFTGVGGTPIYASGGPYTNNNNTPINESICVPTGSQVIFTILDSYGDGICCSEGTGSYTVTVNGVTVATGGSFGASESSTFFAPLLTYDIMMGTIKSPFPVLGSNETITLQSSLKNTSSTVITALNMSYQVGTEPVVTESFTGLNIPTAAEYPIVFSTLWTPQNTGAQTLKIWVNDINNGNADLFPSNDTTIKQLNVYQGMTIPNIIDDFLAAPPVYSTIATAANQINKPTDLDFHSILSRKELWVINEDASNTGGSTVTISDAGLPTQSSQWLRDGNAWHFMSLPTGLAFGTNGNWGSSPGIYNANHNGGAPFTGPTLWSSEMSIYAQNAGPGTNGSHLDMLHETPYGMGIAHHKDNAYWVFDGNSSNIVYYDFVEDHGPGQSYHGDAIIRRYTEVTVSKDGDVPSHLILNKSNGWLYIIDTGNDRVLRMNTNTGNVKAALTPIEAVVEYSEMENVVSETVIDTGLVRPCGIDLVGDRLIVGDYANGDIRIYDISANPATYLGKLSTGAAGLTGIKIGPEGNIWFTNRLTNMVQKITATTTTGLSIQTPDEKMIVYPNPASDQVHVQLPNTINSKASIQIVDALGRVVVSTYCNNKRMLTFNTSTWANGMYWLSVEGDVQKITIQK
ncbi:T9SS type A sorting domain-containing protein [Aureispira anguillae]|uniref:T9SS type A sorting domain-containing protein n=1 Tax=Aureispira anguillae TaxID=2864201 RepID=A0A915YHQ4_9BACT|nr:T9SS type A sorting domain-containing protein [Aureispira anguillae]BDS13222.1 T9SS type A sorting domain-containing protein [Aureispira anguillae]